MPVVVGVVFNDRTRVSYHDPGELSLRRGTQVVAESNRGVEIGKVLTEPFDLPAEEVEPPIRRLLRIMTEADRQQQSAVVNKGREAYHLCEELIRRQEIEIKLVEAEYTFDLSRIYFYFVAEERIDFRDLVKDLAAVLKKRIQLHQIGVRDTAKRLGGCGACGRELCCSTWLRAFDPISIRLAKEQGLPLNPIKLSGACGRLKCCLRYENVFYKELSKLFPKIGAQFETPHGMGKVVDRNILKGEVVVIVPEQGRYACPCGPDRCDGRALVP